jgi:FK506-binding protein 4/5
LPRGATHCTYGVRVPAPGVPYEPCTAAPQVVVHYEGRLSNGKVFDSSRFRDKTFKFDLGEGRVIKGWEEGLSSMQVGELSTLTCAPEYAYGAEGNPPGIPPAAVLTFEVEFVSMIQPRVEASSSSIDLDEYLDDDDWY